MNNTPSPTPRATPGVTHTYMLPSAPSFDYIGEDVTELADCELYSEVMECGVPLLEILAAMARGYMLGNPVATLGKALGTAACDAPGVSVLTGIGSRPAPLNLLLCFAGPSGIGKGNTLSAPLVCSNPQGGYRSVTPASGEALVNAFFESVPAADGKGTEVVRHSEPVWANWGEIDAFAAKSGNANSTLNSALRSLFTGEGVGDESISRLKSGFGTTLEAGSYRFVMAVGAQPDHSDSLLEDKTGGLLQRLLWVPLVDDDGPDNSAEVRAYRAQLANLVGVPPSTTADGGAVSVSVWGPRFGFTVDQDILDGMADDRCVVLKGGVVDPLATHINNLRIRLALIFAGWVAGLGNPAHVEENAWYWASCVTEISRRVRRDCEEAAERKRDGEAEDLGKRDAIRQEAKDAEKQERERAKITHLQVRITDYMRAHKNVSRRQMHAAVTFKSNRHLFEAAMGLCVDASDVLPYLNGRAQWYKFIGK